MIHNYPTLRIRQIGTRFECELTDPKSMQVVSIYRKKAKFTAAVKKILSSYGRLVDLASSDEKCDEIEFSNERYNLSNETGKILTHFLKNLGFSARKERYLALVLDDQTVKIPWELAFISKDIAPKNRRMFSDALRVGRMRVVKRDHWFDHPDRRRTNRALVVGTNYKNCKRKIRPLDYAEDEAEKVAAILASKGFKKITLLSAEKATKKAVLDEIKQGVDVFHFTGHGAMSRNSSKICLNDGNLSAKDFERESKNCIAPRLTFFNACESSVDTPKTSRPASVPYSWAYAIAAQGGRAFIGTFWSVCEPYAGIFAQKFYQEFFGRKRTTLAEALEEARDEIIVKEDTSDNTWTGYVLYGIPVMTKSGIMR